MNAGSTKSETSARAWLAPTVSLKAGNKDYLVTQP
jgi:hypothetical protein